MTRKNQLEFNVIWLCKTMLMLWLILNILSAAKAATTVAKWYGDKKGAVSITFQDGLPSQFNNAFPLLQQHGLKATFFMKSAGVDVNAAQMLAADGQEIGSQTVDASSLASLTYEQQIYQLQQSQLSLQSLTGQKVVVLAYPNANDAYNAQVRNVAMDYYIAARSADSTSLNSSSPTPEQFFRLYAIGPHIRFGPGDTNAIAGLQYDAERAASEQKWFIELFHSVGVSGGYDTISSQAFNTHLDYLVANEPNLWVAPMGVVSEYIKERDTAVISTLLEDVNVMHISLTCELDSRFTTPLTLLTDCPADWELGDIYVKQGLTQQLAEVISKNGNIYIRYNAVPNAETIELSANEALPVYYTITASSDSNGIIDPNGDIQKLKNSGQTFTAVPNPGYQVDKWFVDGVSVQSGGRMYSLTLIAANHNVYVTFKPYCAMIALWQGNKKAAISITFDDGLISQYTNAFPVLQQRGLKATFFIISGYVNAGYSGYMNAAAIQTLVADGQEIGSHSITHPYLAQISYANQVNELSGSQLSLQQLTGQKVHTIAYPYGNYDATVMDITNDYYIAARATEFSLNNASPTSDQLFRLYTVGPYASAGLQSWVNDAISQQKWLIEMFHSVGYSGGYDNVSVADFNDHMDFLVANEPNAWIAPMGVVCEYIYERDNASVATLVSESNSIQLDLHCGLDSRFTTPLTLLTECPVEWELVDVIVKQGQTEQIAEIVSINDNLYLMYDAVPEAGTIELTPDSTIITAYADSNGTIDPNGEIAKDYGSGQIFTATPNQGYEVDKWFVDDTEVQTGGINFTLSNITAPHTVAVTFKTFSECVISGYILEPDGNTPVAGVLMQTDHNDVNAITDVNGFYVLQVGCGWTGTVTPQKPGYIFDPNNREYVNVPENQNSQDYTGWTLGQILIIASAGSNGAIDPDGEIAKDYGSSQMFTAIPNIGYEVDKWFVDDIAVQTGGVNFTLNNITAPHTVTVTFKTLSACVISGYVLEPDGNTPVAGVMIQTDHNDVNAITDANGFYVLQVGCGWTGVVTPQKQGCSFDPNNRQYSAIQGNQNNQNYTAETLYVTISGYIRNDCNVPISGITVSADGSGQTITDVNGYYELSVHYNWSGSITPVKNHHTFEPADMIYTAVIAGQENQNYQASNIFDVDCDGSIGYSDTAILGANWLEDTAGDICDFNNDGIVNFVDYTELTSAWVSQ